jgi:hypothetical protein
MLSVVRQGFTDLVVAGKVSNLAIDWLDVIELMVIPIILDSSNSVCS